MKAFSASLNSDGKRASCKKGPRQRGPFDLLPDDDRSKQVQA